MTSESMVQGRRNSVLAAVIGTVLASVAGSASALEFEFDNGTTVNWNTTLSVGSSWRAEDASKFTYAYSDASLVGKYNLGPPTYSYPVGSPQPRGSGVAGNWAAGEAALNYEQYSRFSTPLKLLSDVEIKKGDFGALVRFKAWYDQALKDEEVAFGHQANDYNGARVLGPSLPNCFLGLPIPLPALFNCIPLSTPGDNRWPRAKMSDKGFEDEQQFDGIMLLDAYVYGSFDVGDTNLQLRLGNQVVNWGESVFIQGINQINPIDVPAARRAGAELKEILLPVWMAYANWGFSFGSVEAFYQFKWDNTSVDGCGTYWAQTSSIVSSKAGVCNSATAIGTVYGAALAGNAYGVVPQWGSAPFLQAQGLYLPLVNGEEASDSGQFGLAFRFPIDAIDTEIGVYGMNIHSRLPMISSRAGTSLDDFSDVFIAPGVTAEQALIAAGLAGRDAAGGYWRVGSSNLRSPIPFHTFAAASAGLNVQSGGAYWEYPEDITIFGLTAATNLFGWSVSAEASFQQDVPVQINGNDLLLGGLGLIGPNAEESIETYQRGTGAYLKGYDEFDKTQFQVNTVKTMSNVLGADNLLFIGEVGMQWNDVPDYDDGNVRYGRGFMWGYGSSDTWPLPDTCTAFGLYSAAGSLYNPSSRGCKNDGYVTDFAWGYRLRVSADYLNVVNSGITVTPSVFWSQDVDGVSMDPTFIEDRSVLGLGLKFTYNKQYVFDMNWVQYGDNGYDPLQDRDFYSASFSVTF